MNISVWRRHRVLATVSAAIAIVPMGVFAWNELRTEHGARRSRTDVSGALDREGVTISEESVSPAVATPIEATEPRGSPAAPDAGRTPPPDYASAQGSASPSGDDQRAFLQITFEKEPVDGSWARGAQAELGTAIEKQLPASAELTEIECRTSMCRAEIDLDNRTDYQTFMMQSRSLWSGAFALSRAKSGDSWAMLAFFAKPGQDLPVLE